MATNATWTVVFEDKKIIKQNGSSAGTDYVIDDDAFWNDSKWSNIWAIQYIADNEDHNDTVEYRDTTPHTSWVDANLGSFRSQFIDKWDAHHLSLLQSSWDEQTLDGETEAEKIARIGERPTSYSS